jgi:hypothetical protein
MRARSLVMMQAISSDQQSVILRRSTADRDREVTQPARREGEKTGMALL